jgi:MFS family permease
VYYAPPHLAIGSDDLVDVPSRQVFQAALTARKARQEELRNKNDADTPPSITPDEVGAALDKQKLTPEARKEADLLLSQTHSSGVTLGPVGQDAVETTATEAVKRRAKEINGRLTLWAGITSLMLNLGAFFGIYLFSVVAQYLGRRPTFAISFIIAGVSTALTFLYINRLSDVFWMIPIMGFCQLSLFGGYAIYFPELFPTRLRSTGTSFCYNVGRFVAAAGPSALGLLTGEVFKNYPQPMRYAGVTMCLVFVLGLIALPFAPETKGKPLPE